MLAVTLVDLGAIGGLIFLAIVLVFLLRPLKLHVTVRHERDDSQDTEED